MNQKEKLIEATILALQGKLTEAKNNKIMLTGDSEYYRGNPIDISNYSGIIFGGFNDEEIILEETGYSNINDLQKAIENKEYFPSWFEEETEVVDDEENPLEGNDRWNWLINKIKDSYVDGDSYASMFLIDCNSYKILYNGEQKPQIYKEEAQNEEEKLWTDTITDYMDYDESADRIYKLNFERKLAPSTKKFLYDIITNDQYKDVRKIICDLIMNQGYTLNEVRPILKNDLNDSEREIFLYGLRKNYGIDYSLKLAKIAKSTEEVDQIHLQDWIKQTKSNLSEEQLKIFNNISSKYSSYFSDTYDYSELVSNIKEGMSEAWLSLVYDCLGDSRFNKYQKRIIKGYSFGSYGWRVPFDLIKLIANPKYDSSLMQQMIDAYADDKKSVSEIKKEFNIK